MFKIIFNYEGDTHISVPDKEETECKGGCSLHEVCHKYWFDCPLKILPDVSHFEKVNNDES